MRRRLALLLVAATLAGCARGPSGAPGDATVRRVVDGDTIVVSLDGQELTVRLLGIDTPETQHPDKPVECHGPEASARMIELLPAGTPVRLTRDVELHDRFGRVLAYVSRATDGLDVNLTMVVEGHADALSIAPNTARSAELAAAVRTAREAGAGLWGACAGPGVPAAP